MSILNKLCSAILMVCGILMFHKTIYLVLGFFCRARQYPPTQQLHRYAFVIAARNEEAVIGNLLDSIRKQTYPQALLEVFVVADNCRDRTAEVAQAHGAIVYERFDETKARKGYALQYLFEKIRRDYGIGHVDGYFIFDADNLLHPDFTARMNEAFDAGNPLVTGYRNTKNFDTNWISSAYGIHFYSNSMALHRPRSALKVGTHLTGTGYLMAASLLEPGWNYTTFTEDDQITMVMGGRHKKVAYCEAAEFFDEQPCDFKTVFRQRVRWAKGRLVNFFRYGGAAFLGIFRYGSFTCYDLFTHYFPYGLFSWFVGILYPAISLFADLLQPGAYDYRAMLLNTLSALGTAYAYALLSGILTVVRERRHIRCSRPKLLLYLFCYPWFNLISVPIYLVALCSHVTWTPIRHDDARTIESLLS